MKTEEVEDERKYILNEKLKKFTVDDDAYDFIHPLRPDDIISQDSDESNDDI
jgi:hypothetical protein